VPYDVLSTSQKVRAPGIVRADTAAVNKGPRLLISAFEELTASTPTTRGTFYGTFSAGCPCAPGGARNWESARSASPIRRMGTS